MKSKKNSVSVLLIVSSMVLLLALEGMWLFSSYKNARQELGREINQLFKSTVYAMHDSLMQRNIVAYNGDSIPDFKVGYFPDHDSMGMPPRLRETDMKFFNIKDKAVRVEIVTSSTTPGDTSDRFIKRIIGRARHIQSRDEKPGKTFVLRLGADSLNTDSLKIEFANALRAANIELPVVILKKNAKIHLSDDKIVSEQVQINPLTNYRAVVENTNRFVWKKISPQILFAIFSIGLTAFSFLILFRSLRSQQRLMEMKNDFIGNITHELKTPIATVSVALEALKGFDALKDPKRTEEYLTMAQNELNRLTLLTDNVLKMTTLEDKGLQLLKTNLDLNEIIDRILNSLKLLFEKQNAVVSYEKEGEDFIIRGSDIHLTNVIYNLIDNALKYGNSNKAIAVNLHSNRQEIVLRVKDNGIGIAKEFHSKIFSKFFRVPTGNVHDTHGYGLGLNYVSEVVHQHGGKIEVKSEPGLGSEFIVTLPKTESR